MNIVIVDIDGTISNLEHRLHYIQGEGKPDWDGFHAAVGGDSPIPETIKLVKAMHAAGYRIVMVTGRMARCLPDTIAWLGRHGVPYNEIYTRLEGDFRQDYEIKEEVLHQCLGGPGAILLALDDRQQVVDMWRRHGIRTLQVADGKY